ncbi:MAG: hypothetical protein ACLGG6_08735 [Gammaproteobacteria bacterium]
MGQKARPDPRWHSRPAPGRDALFDAPYEASDTARAEPVPALVRATPKKQVAALFRSPVKTDSTGQ